MTLTDDIKHKALQLGFDLVGITDASPLTVRQVEFFADWLKAGYAGRMTYLHRNLEERFSPTKLLPNAQSVIVVALNFKPLQYLSLRVPRCFAFAKQNGGGAKQSHSAQSKTPTGRIAAYAQYEDYHPFIKTRLCKLSDFITAIAGENLQFKICVDSAPLAERAFAVRAGLGFIGKNRMLINPQLGPQLFLGEIITTLKLQPDKSIVGNCSGCNKCIAACPTGALQADGFLNANKCINYLTIEYKGQISSDLSQKIGDRLFGCDDCILACPYQQNAPPCKNKDFKFYADRANLNLHDVLALTEKSFKAKFADSVIKRPGLQGLKRNTRICLENSAPSINLV